MSSRRQMNALAHIACVETGEVRVVPVDWTDNDYMWSEGNYACDCNRALFFARAKGGELDPPRSCSRGKYRVRIVVGEKAVYED
jgi:hypothetical protein